MQVISKGGVVFLFSFFCFFVFLLPLIHAYFFPLSLKLTWWLTNLIVIITVITITIILIGLISSLAAR